MATGNMEVKCAWFCKIDYKEDLTYDMFRGNLNTGRKIYQTKEGK